MFYTKFVFAMNKALLISLLLCVGCQKYPEKKLPPFALQQFNGRDENIAYRHRVRRPVYQAKVPLQWRRIDPAPQESLLDTTKPIVSFTLDEHVVVTVHTFPTDSLEERIPPALQVERWQRQMKGGSCHIENVGHGGFTGLYFEGSNDQKTSCCWSLQLDLDHYQTLHFLAESVEEEEHYKQMAADYTIKVTAPSSLIEKYREEISLFANSFDLIQELPTRM
jgi:hypothetical protein